MRQQLREQNLTCLDNAGFDASPQSSATRTLPTRIIADHRAVVRCVRRRCELFWSELCAVGIGAQSRHRASGIYAHDHSILIPPVLTTLDQRSYSPFM